MKSLRRMTLGLLLGLALTGALASDNSTARALYPASERAICKHVKSESFTRTELFFGLSRQGGPDITEQEFQGFLDGQITPRFPDGLTVLSGRGQFKTAAGVTIQEGSKLVILLYPFNKQSSTAVEDIRTEYKSMFQQESVLRIDEPTCVSF